MVATLFRDIRYAARTLATKPGFAAAALVTLALAIGANTLVFSLVDALGFVLRSQLFGVGSVDPPSLIAVALVLAATAFAACLLPAPRRPPRTARGIAPRVKPGNLDIPP